MAVIATYNHAQITPDGEEDDRPGPAILLQRLTEAESLIAPGGLRVRDSATGLTVNPSCCCGLESWQEWSQVAPGQSPWLGHDPAPWTEHLGHTIRVWPDGGFEEAPPAGTTPIEIPATGLSGLIADAHRQLQDFLNLLAPWALALVGDPATSLGNALATHFNVDWTAASQ
jgi:hypothetical protein